MDYTIIAVDTNTLRIYDFLKDGETEQDLLQRANIYKQKEIETWTENLKKYPCESFENYLKESQEMQYKIMPYSEYEKIERDFYINSPLIEVTEEIFDDMLNVLPPLKWCTIDNINMFCMSEMQTGTYTSQYAHDKTNDKYYSKMVDCMDKSTWINEYLKQLH